MIDDGPRFKLMLYRMIKRFELDLAAWPRPPQRAGDDWGDYWQCRFEDVLFRVGIGVRRLIESAKLSIEVQGPRWSYHLYRCGAIVFPTP